MLVSVLPCCASCSAGKMSTGTASSSAAVWRAREPTTTSIGASWTVLRTSVKSCRTVPPASTVTRARRRLKADQPSAHGEAAGRHASHLVSA